MDETTGVAVVAGGGAGLGAALAARCATAGYAVAVLDIDAARAESSAETLRSGGATALAIVADVADRTSLDAAAARVGDELGRCDLVFANVGIQQFGELERFTEAEWEWVLSVNLLGVVRTVLAFLPLLRATDGDRHVVLTSSDSALAPSPRIGPYIVAKAGVTAFGDVLAMELATDGIGVTTVFPAGMITNQLGHSADVRPAALGPLELRDDDIQVVSAHAAPTAADVAMPEDAAARVLEQVLAGERYVVTHGSSRARFDARVAELSAAYDRMEA